MIKDLENEDIMTYIHYLGLDDNIELFEDLKDEIRFVIGYSKRNNLDFCLVDDFENGYFKDFELVKQFDKLCCIKEIESFIEKPLETKLGTFYISNDSERELFYCKLYDSNKEWVANITYKSTINKLINMESIEDFVEIGISDNAIWNNDLNELFDTYVDIVGSDYIEEYEKDLELFKEYVNQVGEIYFVLDFDMI